MLMSKCFQSRYIIHVWGRTTRMFSDEWWLQLLVVKCAELLKELGEPNCPMAAVERGRRVLVSRNQSFEVADHDFTKFSLIPSVSLVVDIPEEVSNSWYTGQVLVGVKEGAYESSSSL